MEKTRLSGKDSFGVDEVHRLTEAGFRKDLKSVFREDISPKSSEKE